VEKREKKEETGKGERKKGKR